jgi:hypothetical protein
MCKMAASPVPAVALVMPGTRRATGIDWFGPAWVAAECRRGVAPVRIVRHGKSGGAAGVARNPGRQSEKKPESATLRRIKIPLPEGSLPHCKSSLAEPFAILENAALSVRSNIMDMDEVAGVRIVR